LARAGTFKPGESGNPGGRPKALVDVIDLARAHTPAAIASLARIAGDEKQPSAAIVAASIALLDRGWGKPTQPNEHTGKDGAPLIPTLSVVVARE
jgi:hypothetical protein